MKCSFAALFLQQPKQTTQWRPFAAWGMGDGEGERGMPLTATSQRLAPTITVEFIPPATTVTALQYAFQQALGAS